MRDGALPADSSIFDGGGLQKGSRGVKGDYCRKKTKCVKGIGRNGEEKMAIILVLAFFAVYVNLLFITKYAKTVEHDTMMALPYAVTSYFTYLFVVTEILSAFEEIVFPAIVTSWGVFILVNCVSILGFVKRHQFTKMDFGLTGSRTKTDRVVILCFILIAVGMLVIAFHTVPYNLDSTACYLPKVTHWAQNRSIRHYATNALDQITAPDFAQYIRLHAYILDGFSDRSFTLVQCICFIISILMVYMVSLKLGCQKAWSYVSAGIFLSLPIAFAEAMNTQYDVITALFVLSFVLLLLRYLKSPLAIEIDAAGLLHTAITGLAVGLAFITKATAVMAIAVFLLLLFWQCLRARIGWKKFGVSMCAAMIPAFILMAPAITRSYHTFGVLFTKDFSTSQVVETADPRLLFLCFIKNLCFNFSGHFIYGSKSLAEMIPTLLARALHIDLVDPRISLKPFYNLFEPFNFNHDSATGELICILFCIASVVAIASLFKKKHDNFTMGYVLASFGAFVLFLTTMKYTSFRTRYEICYFALLCPAVCVILQKHFSDKVQLIMKSCIVFFCACELLSLFIYHAQISALFNEEEKQFARFRHLRYTYASYDATTTMIKEKGYKSVGLTGEPWMEYWVWVLLGDAVERIECVGVDNATSKYEDQGYMPDCILYIGRDKLADTGTIDCHGEEYRILERYFDEGDMWYIVAERE